jgi:hypothetical protein
MAVENVDHNADGSITVYARDCNGDPIVKTYAPGTVVTRLRTDAS